MPEVSVILPTYNRAGTLGRAVESVLNQSFRDLELIVVDDGSTDDTEHYLKDIMHSDKRVKYLKLQTNSGAPNARNAGISVATGKYIAFQDSDDEWLEGKLIKQVQLIKALPEDVGMVYCFVRFVKNDGSSRITNKRKFMPETTDLYKTFLRDMWYMDGMVLQGCLFRRNVFELCGCFDENILTTEDKEFLLRVSKEFKFYCIDEPLVNRYRVDTSLSQDRLKRAKSSVKIFNKYYDDIKKDWVAMYDHYSRINRRFERAGMKREAIRYKIKARYYSMLVKIQNLMRVG